MSFTPRVLVVDDDEAVATSLTLILNKFGFEAVAAFSGTSAIELAHRAHFDMLVTNFVMSPVDGVRTAIVFRNINPASQIFLITGTPEAAREQMTSANAEWDFRIFAKPIDPAQLVAALRSA
jgi:DNA-binding NtrC family response regulator